MGRDCIAVQLKSPHAVPDPKSVGPGAEIPAMGALFRGPGEAGKNAGIVLPFKMVQSLIQGSAAHGRAGCGSARRKVVRERSYRREPRR
jgi:hypothetical protein